jgi:hypothetical protein
MTIAKSPHGLAPRDLVFWVAVSSLVVVRWLDVTRLEGKTAEGEPATMTHWRHYAAVVTGSALAAWLLAHAVAFFLGP